MKKMKLKKIFNEKKKSDKLDKSENSQSIQQLIFEDIKNINKFNIIIEEFIIALQNDDDIKSENISNVIIEIFEYFFVKNKTIISQDLEIFLHEKLKIIINVYLELIDIDSEEENSKILKKIIKFSKFTNDDQLHSILTLLIKLFVCNNELVEPSMIKIFTKIFKVKIFIFNKLFKILEEFMMSNNTNENNMDPNRLFNIYNFIISSEKISQENQIKLNYQNILIKLINQTTIPREILQNLLLNLNKFIFENLENPLIFSDYLINIYEQTSSSEFDIKVLSLNGLFVLITKYKLDYANYYAFLYKTISMKNLDDVSLKTVFDSKYRKRFFKLIELSLKSPTVPIIVILSFIKKLARICMQSTSSNIIIILGIIQNLIKLHPRSILLLIRKRRGKSTNIAEKIKENSKFDWQTMNLDTNPELNRDKIEESLNTNLLNLNCDYSNFEQFDDNELDPYSTKADFSCLWELYSFKNHFSHKVRGVARKFENNFLMMKVIDTDTCANIVDVDLLYELVDTSNFYFNARGDNYSQLNNLISDFI